jgi:hypothetical protein
MTTQENRLAEIRKAIEAENVSYGELSELQDLAATHPQLFADDPLLAEAAGIPEEQWQKARKAPKLTAKAKRENASRKRRAREVLAEYGATTGNGDEEHETNLSDLLADCMHLMGPEAVEDCLRRGAMHYEAEARGEE